MHSTDAHTDVSDIWDWRKSSLSGGSGCIEVAIHAECVHLRDSDRPGAVVDATRYAWSCFLASVKAGEFDATP
jgi:Domain of unknown function (DUF397)